MLAYVIQGLAYGFAAAVQPGPLQAYLIAQTVRNGWRRTLPATLAPLISDGPIIIMVMAVLSQVPAWLQRSLHVAGGLFLLYLAYGALAAWRSFREGEPFTGSPGGQSVIRAAILNVLNPGPYLFWSLVTGPILLSAWREDPMHAAGFLTSFYAAIVCSMGAIVLAFGSARRLGPKVHRALLGLSAMALLGFGLYQLWLALAALPIAPPSGKGRAG